MQSRRRPSTGDEPFARSHLSSLPCPLLAGSRHQHRAANVYISLGNLTALSNIVHDLDAGSGKNVDRICAERRGRSAAIEQHMRGKEPFDFILIAGAT